MPNHPCWFPLSTESSSAAYFQRGFQHHRAEADSICFDKTSRQLRLVGAVPYLVQILLHYREQALAHRHWRSSSLRSTIENALTPLLPHGDINIDAIAQRLGVSRRTLAR